MPPVHCLASAPRRYGLPFLTRTVFLPAFLFPAIISGFASAQSEPFNTEAHRDSKSPRWDGSENARAILTEFKPGLPKMPAGPMDAEQSVQISEYVREVFQDRDGVFWFGTNGDGVARYDGDSLTFISVQDGLAGSAVRGILQDESGALWFATDSGVSHYDSGVFTNYTMANGLSDNSIWSMMLDSSGTLWVGTHEGVCRFDGTTFFPFPLPRVEVENPTSRFSPRVVFGMFEDQAGNLWFGTDGEGLHKYDGTSFTSYTDKDGLVGNTVRCITGDRRGRLWIGTNGNGASCFDGTTFQNFTTKDGLNNDRVYEILEDKAGNMWFSTLGAGACYYDGTSFTSFGADQGLTINDLPCPCGSGSKYRNCHGPNGAHVQEIFEDQDGVLWAGCSGGLFRFDGTSFINVTRDGPWPEREPAPAPESLEGWASEVISLPPAFAPELPTGKEALLFAPGWRDSNAEDFWSYAFVMWIDESAPGTERIDELLEHYYDGLMSVLGIDKEVEVGSGPALVEVVRTGPNQFEATMRLIDGFVTFKPIDLHLMIEAVAESDDRVALRIQVSPQPKDHKVWRSLVTALASIQAPDDALQTEGDAKTAGPMAHFARFVSGEWQVTFESKWSLFVTWNWGLGKHSVLAQTVGTDAAGGPWNSLQLVYWHPGRQQICTLGLSSFARGVSEGTVEFDGETGLASFDLYQTAPFNHREMGRRWVFDGPDRYVASLWEVNDPPMGSWEYVRTMKSNARRSDTDRETPKPSDRLKIFEPLLGHTWEAKLERASGDALLIQSTFEWVPYTDIIRVHTAATAAGDVPTHQGDTYLYHHTGTNTLRCLALSESGGVYEGDVTGLEDGAIQFDLTGYEGDQVTRHVVRLDFEQDGTLRNRVWSSEGARVTEGTLVLDVHHRKIAPGND